MEYEIVDHDYRSIKVQLRHSGNEARFQIAAL
jgi:hypothetical protein